MLCNWFQSLLTIRTKSTGKSFAENHNKLILKQLENSQMAREQVEGFRYRTVSSIDLGLPFSMYAR